MLCLLTCLVLHISLGSLGDRGIIFVDEYVHVCVCVGGWIGLWPNSTVSLLISIASIALIGPMLKIGARGRPKHSVFIVVTKHGYLYALITFLS